MVGEMTTITVVQTYALVQTLGIVMEIMSLIFVQLDVVRDPMLITTQEQECVWKFVPEPMMLLEHLTLTLMIVLEIIILKSVFRVVLLPILGQIGKLIDVKVSVQEKTLQRFQHIHKILMEDALLL